jgi:hypothetical protein
MYGVLWPGYFQQPEVLVHEGGHFVPTSGGAKLAYLAFLTQAGLYLLAGKCSRGWVEGGVRVTSTQG